MMTAAPRYSRIFPTDPAFEPSLRQHQSLLLGNAILGGRDKGPERALEIQSTDCGDKTCAEITLDLVRRAASLQDVKDQTDWAAWYRKTLPSGSSLVQFF